MSLTTQKIELPAGAREGSQMNWIVVNPAGALLAILDSESESYFFTKNRGHAEGAVYSKAPIDYAAAPDLLAVAGESLEMLNGNPSREAIATVRAMLAGAIAAAKGGGK